MSRVRPAWLGALLALLLSAAACERETPPLAPPAPAASSAAVAQELPALEPAPLEIDTVAGGLDVPWALAFAPDGRIFITERPGRIRVIEKGGLREEPWAAWDDVFGVDEQIRPESGLMGIALAPDFAETGHVYVLGTFWKSGQARSDALPARLYRRLASMVSPGAAVRWENRVYRLTDRSGQGTDPDLIVGGLPANYYHAGGALAFGPDGMLYLTIGDVLDSPLAQDPASLTGAVLRYRPDGGIPNDNPFPGSPVWAHGLRNTQGLVWHPSTRELFASDHGPTFMPHESGRFGHDELNAIRRGGNYGWPIAAGDTGDPRFAAPLVDWSPGIAPSSIAFYTGAGSWSGDLLVGSLRGAHLQRLRVQPDSCAPLGWSVTGQERLLEGELGRIRAVRMGPDGFLYLTTSNRDGRGEPRPGDDHLLRVRPRR